MTTRVVHPGELARALAGFPGESSGLLPHGAVWWGGGGSRGPQVALYRPARVWRAALLLEAFKPPERFAIPMPPFVFLCRPGSAPSGWAVKRRPQQLDEPLYRLPCFNVFANGLTCQGTARYSDDVRQHPDEFFGTFFSRAAAEEVSAQHGRDIAALWSALAGRRRYPLDDLMRVGALRDALERKER